MHSFLVTLLIIFGLDCVGKLIGLASDRPVFRSRPALVFDLAVVAALMYWVVDLLTTKA